MIEYPEILLGIFIVLVLIIIQNSCPVTVQDENKTALKRIVEANNGIGATMRKLKLNQEMRKLFANLYLEFDQNVSMQYWFGKLNER